MKETGAVPGTFSIVARDPQTGHLGVAVQSKFLAVGAQVPGVKAGVGAVAAHVWFNRVYREHGLKALEQGSSPQEALTAILQGDAERNVVQVGIVDARGRVAAHTGKYCFPWAGQVVGQGFVCLGNVLAGSQVVEAMAEAFQKTRSSLAERLVEALAAGHAAGGDWRGRESAALLVFGEDSDTNASSGPIDFRVDHHADPIAELHRLLTLRSQRFPWKQQASITIEGDIAMVVQVALRVLGYSETPPTWQWDPPTREGLRRFCDAAGLHEPHLEDGRISVATLGVLRQQYAVAE